VASLKDIRARIETTKNTQQITKAMKLVSAAKLRKAQNQILNLRPYANTIIQVIRNLVETKKLDHPLLSPRENPQKVLLVVLASDRGLCGGFNAQINRFAENYLQVNSSRYQRLDMICVGRRVIEYFTKRSAVIVETVTKLDKDASYPLAKKVSDRLLSQYLNGDYDEIRLIYNEFKSAISQKVVCETLLPVDLNTVAGVGAQAAGANQAVVADFSKDYIFEPSPAEMLPEFLEKYFAIQVYRCMCESVASEHGARMSAMENATNNAKEVLNKLTLTYNKLRQEKITTELIEIVSGAEAL
jgi:F-type H+-transporting ATPase subunit gamma